MEMSSDRDAHYRKLLEMDAEDCLLESELSQGDEKDAPNQIFMRRMKRMFTDLEGEEAADAMSDDEEMMVGSLKSIIRPKYTIGSVVNEASSTGLGKTERAIRTNPETTTIKTIEPEFKGPTISVRRIFDGTESKTTECPKQTSGNMGQLSLNQPSVTLTLPKDNITHPPAINNSRLRSRDKTHFKAPEIFSQTSSSFVSAPSLFRMKSKSKITSRQNSDDSEELPSFSITKLQRNASSLVTARHDPNVFKSPSFPAFLDTKNAHNEKGKVTDGSSSRIEKTWVYSLNKRKEVSKQLMDEMKLKERQREYSDPNVVQENDEANVMDRDVAQATNTSLKEQPQSDRILAEPIVLKSPRPINRSQSLPPLPSFTVPQKRRISTPPLMTSPSKLEKEEEVQQPHVKKRKNVFPSDGRISGSRKKARRSSGVNEEGFDPRPQDPPQSKIVSSFKTIRAYAEHLQAQRQWDERNQFAKQIKEPATEGSDSDRDSPLRERQQNRKKVFDGLKFRFVNPSVRPLRQSFGGTVRKHDGLTTTIQLRMLNSIKHGAEIHPIMVLDGPKEKRTTHIILPEEYDHIDTVVKGKWKMALLACLGVREVDLQEIKIVQKQWWLKATENGFLTDYKVVTLSESDSVRTKHNSRSILNATQNKDNAAERDFIQIPLLHRLSKFQPPSASSQSTATTNPSPKRGKQQDEEDTIECSVTYENPNPIQDVDNFDDLTREIKLARLGDDAKEEDWEEHEVDAEINDSKIGQLMLLSEGPDPGDSGEEDANQPREKGKSRQKEGKKMTFDRKGANYICEGSHVKGSRDNGPNQFTIEVLEKMKTLATDHWRQLTLMKAQTALRKHPHFVDTYEKALQLPGIGTGTAQKISEIVKTGSHRRLELVSEEDKIISTLNGIYGVGKITAQKWYHLGIRTLDDLREGKYGVKLSPAQEIGLMYYKDLQQRIPRAEMDEIGRKVIDVARGLDKRLELTIMGSYRRGAKDSGDIDFAITKNPACGRDHRGVIAPLLGRLKEAGIITYDLAEPEDYGGLRFKYMGLCVSKPGGIQRRIDILGVPWEERGAAWLYFTGNDIFNRSLRLKARHMGYSLNQCGLFKNVMRVKAGGLKTTTGEKVAGESEEDILRILEVKWRPPEERNP